jgi:hypothetical protein
MEPITNSQTDPETAPAPAPATLAVIFMNDKKVHAEMHAKPSVAQIVAASGSKPEAVHVERLKHRRDYKGSPLGPTDVIDRTVEAESPVYLKCFDRSGPPALAPTPPDETSPAPHALADAEPASRPEGQPNAR